MATNIIRRFLTFVIWKISRFGFRARGYYVCLFFRVMGANCEGGLLLGKGFVLRYPPHAGIRIGKNVSIGKNVVFDVPAGGELTLGDRVKIHMDCILAASEKIQIGAETQIAEFSSIRDADHGMVAGIPIIDQKMEAAPIVIGKDVWIGRGVAVLKGSCIGDATVVGANAVVRGVLPAKAIAVGVPARVVRLRGEDEPNC